MLTSRHADTKRRYVTRPLQIYEPRYKEMIADALKGDKIIGMVRLPPGFEKVAN